jgi:hypothetical protein
LASAAKITPEDLLERVEAAPGNITTATLLELRSAYKRGRITYGVLESIRTKLEQDHRIGVLHDGSEPSQSQKAYLYQLDAPIGRLLADAMNPSEAGLRRLREVQAPASHATQADAHLATLKAALEDATTALDDYLGDDDRPRA